MINNVSLVLYQDSFGTVFVKDVNTNITLLGLTTDGEIYLPGGIPESLGFKLDEKGRLKLL